MSLINYFNDQYSKYRIEAVDIIKKELKEQKRRHHNFNYASNKIISYFNNKVDKLIPPGNKQMTALLTVYTRRGEIYDDENLNLILDNEVYLKYNELNPDFSYKHFIDVLAKRESYFKTKNNFNNHKRVYEMMCQHNRFDGYENMEKFDIIRADQAVESLPIYRELRTLVYGDSLPAIKNDKTKFYSKENHFKIKEYYAEALKSKEVFDYLIQRDFLDADKNEYENFKNFINGNFSDKPKLYFKCYNKNIFLLINSLRNNFFDQLTYSWLLNKKLIIDKKGKPIKQASVSSSNSRSRDEEIDEITQFIDFVNKQANNLNKPNN